MAKPKLTVYFDLHSPYAYLAYHATRHDVVFQDCDITYVPVLMIGLAKAGIGHPPWSVPNKVKYLWKDLERCALESHIPWSGGNPALYPGTSTSEVQRAILCCNRLYPEHVLDVLDDLYHAFWVDKLGIQAYDTFKPFFASRLGRESTERVIEMSRTDEARNALRANTEQAIVTGAVGLPWTVATNSDGQGEAFWGFDRLPQLQRFLKLDRARTCRL